MTEAAQKQIFDEWLKQHRALIFKVVRAYALAAVDRDDLFQEIIIQVWRSVPFFRHDSSVPTWLYRISLNTAMKWTRAERKHRHMDDVEHVGIILQEVATHNDDRLTWLYEEIAKLEKIDRSITLLLLDGFSYREMATVLGISESNVGVKINRIKRYLMKKLKPTNYHGI